jgi:hypothetical protein
MGWYHHHPLSALASKHRKNTKKLRRPYLNPLPGQIGLESCYELTPQNVKQGGKTDWIRFIIFESADRNAPERVLHALLAVKSHLPM